MKNNKIAEKIVLQGLIENKTPLIIGAGKSENSDIDILIDENGTPFIPATSLIGVLRHTFIEENGYKNGFNESEWFWGNSKNKLSCQSSIRCSDLYPDEKSEIQIQIRDGVGIDNKTGMADNRMKYSYQILEKGVKFKFRIEISVKENQFEYFNRMALTLKTFLESGNLSIGAKTTSGFGKLRSGNIKLTHYNFKEDKMAFLKWLKNDEPEDSSSAFKKLYSDKLISQNNNINFRLSASFILKTSLLINSGYSDGASSAHLCSLDECTVPGTSFKGIIRARAEKIVNTIAGRNDKNSKIIKSLFGFVDKDKKESQKSKLTIEETYLKGFISEYQFRIRIDRFTGGAINGALFDSLPVWPADDSDVVELSLNISNCKKYEAGLILLVLKDLWTGDCTLGGGKGIGRGVLEGKHADFDFDGITYGIKERFDNICTDHSKDDLQGFVTALGDEIEKECENA